MTKIRKYAVTALALLPVACGTQGGTSSPVEAPAGNHASSHLYVWAQDLDARAGDTDFLAVIDADPSSPRYGAITRTTPVGAVDTGAHHTEPVAPSSGLLFANGFNGNVTFLFDLSDPASPSLSGELENPPGLNYAHSFLRLDDGSVLATFQLGEAAPGENPGGLALFDPQGRLVNATSAQDPNFTGDVLRPYSLEVFTDQDRVITTGRTMQFFAERAADVVQIWRLSDLALLKTLSIPRIEPMAMPECTLGVGDLCDAEHYAGESQPFEVRALADGSALLNTLTCGFFRISDIGGDSPAIEQVLNWPDLWGCSVPALVGDFYFMPVMFGSVIVSLDVSDPASPREVSRYETPGFTPHWIAADPHSNRLVATADGIDPSTSILMFEFDPATGQLTLDSRFGAFEDDEPGVDFDRPSWPHGPAGAAMPHAALFGR